jgi:hypothetical protein
VTTIRLADAEYKEDYKVDDDYRRMLLVSLVGTLIIGTPLVYLLSPLIVRFGVGYDLLLPMVFMYAVIFAILFYLQFRVLVSKLQTQEQPIAA